MSDLNLAVKEEMVNTLSEIFMEHYTVDEIATIWRESVYCNICPYYDICGRNLPLGKDYYCDLDLIKRFEKRVLSKEES